MNNAKYDYSSSKGFTLLEVLVASVILFASIATVSMIYRGAYLSSSKAEQHVKISGVIPSILANVRKNIRQQGNEQLREITGDKMAWDVNYKWRAEQIMFKAPQPTFSPDSGGLDTYEARYKLWQVSLTVTFGSTSKDYRFKELSWNNG